MKRTVDVLISVILLILFMPVMLFLALMIRAKMDAPILFKQERPGLGGKPFWLYKFRTMDNARVIAVADYHRLTELGKFLRKYSLDELPQLINVLKGDMSLVGPRPLLMEYLSLYTKNQKLRHTVKPGITGWAQINGRNSIQWEEKFELDTWYVSNQSFMLDCKILFVTLLKVLKREGINQQNSTTMKKFTGTKEVL
ncbi:sugar transferase [Virgibacillus flavescens]|uniref:sugar transferase n=1 Tax=Virgibacillus flavescens TaxID=1611422 RepID=UPI003D34DFF6